MTSTPLERRVATLERASAPSGVSVLIVPDGLSEAAAEAWITAQEAAIPLGDTVVRVHILDAEEGSFPGQGAP